MLFGVLFLRRSCPIGSDAFTQVDSTHWVLDLAPLVTAAQCLDVRDVCLFLPSNGLLPPGFGLSLHIRARGSGWEHRGFVSEQTPSEVFPTAWPLAAAEYAEGQPLGAQVGVALEPLAELVLREASALASRAEFAKRVAVDLFRFCESFPVTPRGDTLLVPTTAPARWLERYLQRSANDPDWLLRLQTDTL